MNKRSWVLGIALSLVAVSALAEQTKLGPAEFYCLRNGHAEIAELLR